MFLRQSWAMQVKGVPLIAFDVGGVGEMLHYSEHEDVIVMDSSATNLANKLQGRPTCLPLLIASREWWQRTELS